MGREIFITAIDIGSASVRTLVAHWTGTEEKLRVVGVGNVSAAGMRRGVVIDSDEVTRAIHASAQQAHRMSGAQTHRAIINIGGADVHMQNSKGVVAVGRADGEVVEDDVSRVIGEAQLVPLPMNREVVHVIPRSFRLDDQGGVKDPVGMRGVRLEVDALVIESGAAQVKNLTKCVYQAGFEIDDIVLEPLAAATAVLSKRQKELGVAVLNIGSGTTSLAVYEEGELIHTTIIPVGAGHITNDIAIGLRTSIDVAERVKLEYGSALAREVSPKEEIDLSNIDSHEDGIISRHHVAEIIEARTEELFDMVQTELKNIGKAGLLPAGIVLCGGGAKLMHVVELAKEKLGLPVQIGFPAGLGGILDKVDDPSFATVAGLLLWTQDSRALVTAQDSSSKMLSKLVRSGGGSIETIRGWMRKFLP